MIGYEPALANFKASVLKIDDEFKCHDEDLLSTINSIIKEEPLISTADFTTKIDYNVSLNDLLINFN